MPKHIAETPVFILAGGLGTRLSEETRLLPKPMVEIGDLPILLHIMRYYYSFGFKDFVICAGYKGWEIKRYFAEYHLRVNHLEIDSRKGADSLPKVFGTHLDFEEWRVRVIDTGQDTMTGARIARTFDEVQKSQNLERFAVTYGDGLTNAALDQEFDFHLKQNKIGTVLGVKNPPRFGELDVDENSNVEGFLEKPESRQGYINGGFFFFEAGFRKYLSLDQSLTLEREPLEHLARDRELVVFKHDGFWSPMDTLRDKNTLQALWDSGRAPWVRSKNDK